MKIFLSVLIVLFALMVCLILYKMGFFNLSSDNINVSQRYNSKEGRFVISGKKKRFVITKNENIEFLVEDGQIVACKDKRVSDDFVYYGDK